MSILPVLSPPPSCLHFQVGLRAISGNTEKLLRTTISRRLPAVYWAPLASCRQYHNSQKSLGPSRAFRQQGVLPSFSFLPRIQIRTVFKRFRPITHYTHLPADYEDAKGLDFRKDELDQKEVNAIFGGHLKAREANKLLRIIHGRRVAGSLDDPNLQHNTSEFNVREKTKALQYLRSKIPVDEVINAGLRAEDELKALEELEGSVQGDGEQWENTKAQAEKPQKPTGRLPLRSKSDSPYGVSNFDKIRAKNIAKREAEEKRLEEERKQREEEERVALEDVAERQKPKELSPFIKKHVEAATSDLVEPPEMKTSERLLPAFATTILVLGACVLFASYYVPPRKSGRLWPDVPPAAATCLALIGVNIGIYILWKVPPAWRLLNRYMLVIAATPRPVQLVGAIFSHQSVSHLAVNMLTLWFFGTRLHDEIGRGNFLALYVASGAVGFMTSLTDLVLRGGLRYTTLGASGAIYGVMAAFFWLHRFEEFKIFNYPPDPLSGPQGLAFIAVIVAAHLWGLARKGRAIDMVSHLGGMAAGIAGVELIKKNVDERKRQRVAEKTTTMGVLDKIIEKTERPLPASSDTR